MSGKLENYYIGDDAWNNFVSVISKNWEKYESKKILLEELNQNKDIAKVCIERFPIDLLDVINEKSPSLCGKSIVDCCNGDDDLNKRVKTMLMRMP